VVIGPIVPASESATGDADHMDGAEGHEMPAARGARRRCSM
jgi:hypothetical protein